MKYQKKEEIKKKGQLIWDAKTIILAVAVLIGLLILVGILFFKADGVKFPGIL